MTTRRATWVLASFLLLAARPTDVALGLGGQPCPGLGNAPEKGKTMNSEWLQQTLSQNELGFVFFQYRDLPPEEIPRGPRAAMASSRLWQERLMRLPFQVPTEAIGRVHSRQSGQPDAISFVYEAAGFSVQSFHLMDRLAIVLTPLPHNTGYKPLRGQPVEALASRLARAVFEPDGEIDLVVEESDAEGKFGRNRRNPAPAPRRASPIDLIRWWCEGATFGFATEKVTVLEEGKVPSTAGFSPQQVYMWFDTFGIRRYR